MNFPSDSQCDRCPLGLALQPDWYRKHLCIPTRAWAQSKSAETALLVIGKAPARSEDSQGECFVGQSGGILDDWLTALNFGGVVDIFLTNTVRCRLCADDDPIKVSESKACQHWLVQDIRLLQARYKKIVLLVLGGAAASAFNLGSIREACRCQGQPLEIKESYKIWRQSKNRRSFSCRVPIANPPLRSELPYKTFTAPEYVAEHQQQLRMVKTVKVFLPRFVEENRSRPVGTFPAYVTYHPAACLPSREPALFHAVSDHLKLLSDHTLGPQSAEQDPDRPTDLDFALGNHGTRLAKVIEPPVHLALPPPENLPDLVALDIETFGILERFPSQAVDNAGNGYWHPQRAIHTLGIPVTQLVQLVSLAWWSGDQIKSTVFQFPSRHQRQLFYLWLNLLRDRAATVVCANTLFDVTFLRAVGEGLRRNVAEPLMLEDIFIWNYLNNSTRPEKNLEALSRLFGFLGPAASQDKKFRRYKSIDDPALLRYSADDAILTLRVRRHLRSQLSDLASSEYTRRFFSDLIWSCVQLQESGVAIDVVMLEKLLRKCESVRTRTSQEAEEAGWGALHGPGSQPTAAKIIKHGVDVAGLTADPRLKRTKKKGIVSTDRDNVYLLKGALSADDTKARPALALLTEHRDADKIIGTYIKPFMPGLAKNDTQHLIGGVAFSQWFAAPMAYGTGSSSVEGGTVQARPTCKKPALQTAPKRLKECYTVRPSFRPGSEISIDLSQIELRLAALLSGDKKMIQEYVDGVDRHTLRAIAFFGPDVVDKSDFHEKWRHVGKRGNFWSIYRGGPGVLQESVRREVGVELSLDFCYAQHRALPKEYPGLWAAQDEWIARTTRLGFIDEQVLGERRWLSQSEFVNSTKYESTICNFRIQVSAARLLEDIHAGLRRLASAAGLRGLVTLNVFDSLRIECPVQEEDHWKFFFKKALQESDYWCRLQEVTNRTVPLDFDVTVRRFF